ncbi:MAG: hypothetical protein Fur0018_26420 [Anaerolineales bacterium]
MSSQAVPFHILAAVDGSEHAQAMLYLLRDLPLRPGDRIELLTVMLPRHASNYWAVEAMSQKAYNALADSPAEVSAQIITGDPAEEVLKRAADQKPDLIAMGAQGLRAALGTLLGGVAQQVLEYAEQPVLIAHAPYTGLRHVVVGVDESDFTPLSLRYLTQRFPLPQNATCTLVHVLPPAMLPERLIHVWSALPGEEVVIPQISAEERAALERQAAEEQAHGQALLERWQKEMRPYRPVKGVLLRGDAATELIDHSRQSNADLIVAAHRGESGITRWLLGSVARKIAYAAPHAALIVK